jgi:chromate transporter
VIFRETGAWQGFGLKLSIPVLSSLDVFAALLAIAAALAIFRFKVGVIQTLLACPLAGGGLQLAFGVVTWHRTQLESSRCSGAAIAKPSAS